jgi:UDP-glucose 4-epimerase
VLVLGGSGFIGWDIVLELRRAGLAVTILDVSDVDDVSRADAGVDCVIGAVEDHPTLEAALDGVDWVIHAVGCPPPAASTIPDSPTAQGLVGIDVLLEALRTRPEVALTFVSSGGAVYGDVSERPVIEAQPCRPISPYGVSKLQAEQAIAECAETCGLRARIVRVSNAYGPRQDSSSGQGVIAAFLRAALTGEPVPVFGRGRAVRDFVHVADVARAVVTLRPDGDGPLLVNVGAGIGVSIVAVLDLVQVVTGVRLRIDDLPWRSFDVPHIVLDVSRLKALMSWEPRRLETGVAQTWSRMSRNGLPGQLSA